MILTDVMTIIKELKGREIEILPDTMLFDEGILDSFSLFSDLIPILEAKFSFELQPIDIVPENFDTPSNIAHFLLRVTNRTEEYTDGQ